MRVVSILVPGPLLPALLLFLAACGNGSAPAPTSPRPAAPAPPAPPPPPVETVLACAFEVESEWRTRFPNYFLKTRPMNIPLSPDLFADLRPGENPSWNAVRLFYATGQAADVEFTFRSGAVNFGSTIAGEEGRGGDAPGPSLRDPDEYTITLRQGDTTAHLPFAGDDAEDPHRFEASTADSRWLTGLSRCATNEAREGCPLVWDLALVRHFDGGDPFADCPAESS